MSAPTVDRAAGLLAEQAVIGALLSGDLQNSDVPGRIRNILDGPTDFVDPKHALLYEIVQGLARDGLPHPALAVLERMDADLERRTGGVPYVHTCLERLFDVPDPVYAASTIRKAAALRDVAKLGAVCALAAKTSALDDADDVIGRVQQQAAQLRAGARPSSMADLNTVSIEVMEEIERLAELGADAFGGLTTGFTDLDRLLNGIAPGAQLVIAGRPGMGKSTLATDIARHVATRREVDQRKPMVIFSLEMSRLEIGMRIISAGARVPLHLIRAGQLADTDWVRIARYLADTEGAPLLIDDTPGITPSYIDRELSRVREQYGEIGGYVADQLQLMTPEVRSHSRERDVASMSTALKQINMKHQCVGIVVAQLNRGPENRTDKRPTLADLRESGQIEGDADIVILVHRDDYYDKESPRAGEADFIVAKHRNGATDTITVASQLHLSRFSDMAIA